MTKVVSRFEYAIMQAAQVENINEYRPVTKEEEIEQMKQRLIEQAKEFKIKGGSDENV